MLALMGGIASFERDLMLERQRCGIAAAKAAGKYRGRKPTARAKTERIHEMKKGGASVAEIVRDTGLSRASIYRIISPPIDIPLRSPFATY